MLIVSIIFFAVFLGLQHKAAKAKLLDLSLHGLDQTIFLFGSLLTIIYSTEMFVSLQDVLYGFTWNVGLEFKSLLFLMSICVFAIKNEGDITAQDPYFGIRELVVVMALFIGLVSSSILVWSAILIVLLSSLEISRREKFVAQMLPFSLILIEVYSASTLNFITFNGSDIYDVAYQGLLVSCLLSTFFVIGAMVLLVKRKTGNLTNSLCLAGYILAYSKVSSFLNDGEFYTIYHLALTGAWFYYMVRHGAVIEAYYRQSKQVLYLVVLMVLVGGSSAIINQSLFWSAIILISNILLMNVYSTNQELSVLVVSKRILATILFSLVSLISFGALLLKADERGFGVNTVIILAMAFSIWQLLIRLNYTQRYDLKSESLSDFSSAPFVLLLALTNILTLVFIYQLSSSHLIDTLWPYLLVIPSGLILLTNILKKLNEVERHLSFSYRLYPINFVNQLGIGAAESQRVLFCLNTIIVESARMLMHLLKNMLSYICYISDSILEKSIKYKVQVIFIIWIVLISFVTSWSL